MVTDKRKVFDTIPEQFDKWRPRYSRDLYDLIVERTRLGKGKSCLEIGPGTGQATDFALETGCDYTAIELGEHLADFMRRKYARYSNFSMVNADFETHDFGTKRFDLVYSAAAIQWIDQGIAYTKSFHLLKEGGFLAMFLTRSNYRDTNPALYDEIQKIYDTEFVTDQPYTQKFDYWAAKDYGFSSEEVMEFHGERVFTADDYVAFLGTHSTHVTLKENHREAFFGGIRKAILAAGNRLVMKDTYVLYLCRK